MEQSYYKTPQKPRHIYLKNHKITGNGMARITRKSDENLSLSEYSIKTILKKELRESENTEEQQKTLKSIVRGVAVPKATGDMLRISITSNGNTEKGALNIVLIENQQPIMIGGKVLLQVGVTALSEEKLLNNTKN